MLSRVGKHEWFFIVLPAFLIMVSSAFAFDPDAPPETTIPLAPFITFGGNVAFQYELEKNFDLDDFQADTLSIFQPELSLAFSFDPNERFQAFLNVELAEELELARGARNTRRVKLEIKEAFLLFKKLADGRLFFQVGRQRFEDARQWLYDEELDAVVGAWHPVPEFSLELSVSRLDLADRDPLNDERRERINNYIVYGRYVRGEETEIAVYAIARRDQSSARESPAFLGLQASGEMLDGLDSWLDLSYALGRSGSRQIRGFGVDVGSTYAFDLPLEPAISLGYAFGTGDGHPNNGVDTSFRQTGLQENEGEFNGDAGFKYYGELFDPELSNLSIVTGGVGIRPTEESSIDLVYHHYLQHKPSDGLRNARIDADPDGISRALGREMDLIIGFEGFEEIHPVELKLVFGYFIPGKAFPAGSDSSVLTNFEIQYSF